MLTDRNSSVQRSEMVIYFTGGLNAQATPHWRSKDVNPVLETPTLKKAIKIAQKECRTDEIALPSARRQHDVPFNVRRYLFALSCCTKRLRCVGKVLNEDPRKFATAAVELLSRFLDITT